MMTIAGGMRILFVCPIAPPGRSGVGDYTRRLAAECIRQGSAAAVVSLNETIVETVVEEMQEDGGISVPVLRLPSALGWAERWRKASEWAHTVQADVVSLQFVCFGFHRKGLFPMDFGFQVRQLAGRRPVQIMFHELWLGMPMGSSLKHRVWGAMQRWLIQRMLGQLAADVFHTNTRPYQLALQLLGWKAALLPLFGNLPIDTGGGDDLCLELERCLGRRLQRGRALLVGVFGDLHQCWRPEPLAETLSRAGKMMEKEVFILLMGRHGRADSNVNEWNKNAPSNVVFLSIGERSPKQLSRWFLQLDFGAVGTPWALLDKSGSAAAMLEHGVPVLVSRNDWHFAGLDEGPSDPNGRCRLINGDVFSWILASKPTTAVSRLDEIARRFMEAMSRKDFGRSAQKVERCVRR
jgi:hypothetical protein